MAYSIPITLAVICLASIFLFLSKVFAKEQRTMKTLFVMLSLGATVLLAQIMKLIIQANVTGTTLTNLSKMADSALVLTIIIFLFFFLYFFITYTRDLFIKLRDVKAERFG